MKKKRLVIFIAISIFVVGGLVLFARNLSSLYDREYPYDYPNTIWVAEKNDYAYMEMLVNNDKRVQTMLIKGEDRKTYENKFVSEIMYASEKVNGEVCSSLKFKIKNCKNGKLIVWIEKVKFYSEVFNQEINDDEKIYFTFVKQ